MKNILLLLASLFFHGAYSLDMPSQQEVEETMKKQEMHTAASKMLFQSKNDQYREEGFSYLLKESNEGSALSTGKVGWAYQMGWGVSKDIEKAKALYQVAADSGMTYWQYLLAHAYKEGYLGFSKSEEKYQYWLNFQPKIQTAIYECWVANYYEMGIFPQNEAIYSESRKSCDES